MCVCALIGSNLLSSASEGRSAAVGERSGTPEQKPNDVLERPRSYRAEACFAVCWPITLVDISVWLFGFVQTLVIKTAL